MRHGDKKEKLKVYALYKGEEFITEGTVYDISNETGTSVNTLRFYSTPAWRKRTKDNAKRLVCIGKNTEVLV